MFCLSECVRSFKCHERQDIKTPRFVPFSLAEKCKPLKAETSCSCLGNLQLLRANVYIYSACEWIILGGGFSIYLWGKKYQKNWALFSFFFSFRKKYFKKLLLEFFLQNNLHRDKPRAYGGFKYTNYFSVTTVSRFVFISLRYSAGVKSA